MALPHIHIGDGMLGEVLVASVEVAQELNRHWRCTVIYRDTADRRIPTEDLLGQPISITTFDDQGIEHRHFSGFVFDVALAYEVWGSYKATIRAVSDSYRLDVTAHKQYYTEGTLASLAGIIGERGGLSVIVDAPSSKAMNYVQYGETDFSFLNRIVDDSAAWLRPKQGGLEVFANFQPGSALALRQEGDGLLNFSISAKMVPPSFSGSHYDHHAMASEVFHRIGKSPAFFDGGEPLTSAVQSASQQLPAGFEPQRARAMTLTNYSDQLAAESERALGGAVLGQGTSRSQELRAGDTVTITGVLDAAGTYGLIKVLHQWTPEGYTNEFVCTPWKNYRNPDPPPMRQWKGMVPARVVEHNDPKKMGRLRVQFFWQDDGPTHWARMATPHAGPDRGFMFMPEVGDEVAVMFEDGDPERPLIVGSLWNGVHQAPRHSFFGPETDIPDNNVKRVQTKSGNRLHFIDTPEVETVHLATPHHTSARLTEKDGATGRPLLHLHSNGDIVLHAPNGRVHVQSQTFSREIGISGKTPAVGASAPPSTASPHLPAYDRKGNRRPRYNFTYSPEAVASAQAAQKKYGIPASVTLAQYGLESRAGKAIPPRSNNPFGIKAIGDQPFVTARTKEVVGGKLVSVDQNFRKYDSIEQAFDDHGRLLAQAKPYANARKSLPDPDAFADSLSGVYAPNVPGDYTYGEKLGYVMDDGDLKQFNEVH